MKYALVGLALLAACPAVQAQTSTNPTRPPADPLEVWPVAPAKPSQESPEALVIRSKIEANGYTGITDLERDSTGVWHARVTKDNVEVSVFIDKGGRITQQQQ